MFYIHVRSSSRIFQGGGGRGWYLGVAESVGYRRERYYFCSLVSPLHNDIFLSLFYLERQLLVIKMKQLSSVFVCISVIIFTIFIIYLGSKKEGWLATQPTPPYPPLYTSSFWNTWRFYSFQYSSFLSSQALVPNPQLPRTTNTG